MASRNLALRNHLFAIVVTLFVAFVASTAFGQAPPPLVDAAPEAELGWQSIAGMVIAGLFGLFGIAYGLVQRMAARPALDGWDEAKAWMDKARTAVEWVQENKATVAKTTGIVIDWNDPESANVPRSPSNPMGVDSNPAKPAGQ